MGGTTYSVSSSMESREFKGTMRNSIDDNFKQNRERKAHKEMKSQGITLREARDSDVHTCTFPIIIALDLTGSMQEIPQRLIQTGLPKLVSGLIQGGMESPAILFLGVGDHETDREPLQIGQFESGDEEMDLWLERTYLEGNGGGNDGESYGLAHYFAARHCKTDSFEKRGVKGVLITIGDEPSLKSYPERAMKEIMDNSQTGAFSDKEILAEAQKEWEVFHINPRDNGSGSHGGWRDTVGYWQDLLGQNYIGTNDYTKIPNLISELTLKIGKAVVCTPKDNSGEESPKSEDVY